MTEPPECAQTGENKPEKYHDCRVLPESAPHNLDVIGDWRWQENDFWGPVGQGQVACGRLDGHLNNNFKILKGEEEPVHLVGENNPHFYWWLVGKNKYPKVEEHPCHWENPAHFGYHPRDGII